MIQWNYQKFIKVKVACNCSWKQIDQIFDFKGSKQYFNDAKNGKVNFPTQKGRFTNENLTDTLIPLIYGCKKEELIKELK